MREEEKKRTSLNSKWQKVMKKRWVFPAIYLASAAIILTAVLMFQAANSTEPDLGNDTNGQGDISQGDQPAVEVTSPVENFLFPVVDVDSTVIEKHFWDPTRPEDEQEKSFVSYNGIYRPSTGIDIALKDGESFEVVAALSGTVTRAESDPLLGYVVEIDHGDNVKTFYQSLNELFVEVGDSVKQGESIAQAGTSVMNNEYTHVHFEIRKDSIAVNPIDFFNKPLTALLEEESTQVTAPPVDEEEDAPADEEEETPAEDEEEEQDEPQESSNSDE